MEQQKKPFIYSGKNQQGLILEGTVFAATKEDAETMVKRMGAANPSIHAFGDVPSTMIEPSIPVLERELESDHQKNVTAMISGMASSVEGVSGTSGPTIEILKKRIRQSLFIGEEMKVKEQIEPLLANENGKIIQCHMRPNHHGIMVFMIVIEHETKEK